MSVYRHLLKPALFRLAPERAHDLAMAGLAWGSRMPGALRALFGPAPEDPVSVCGVRFPNRVGLAAGMDKNAVALRAWEALGFGHAEVGTVTAKPQPGNPRPRMFRHPEYEALVNRMGFNNEGAAAVAERLARQKSRGSWPSIPVGINLGKSKVTPAEEAPRDYSESFRLLRESGDYFVVNVSSPNTPGLRALQESDALAAIAGAIREIDATKPLFVKLAPDLAERDAAAIVSDARRIGFSGIVATNTTLDHSALAPDRDEAGGLSGRPLRARALALLETVVAHTDLPVIASGGISDAAAAAERFRAGASLVQIYTGFVYRGPELIREISRSRSA